MGFTTCGVPLPCAIGVSGMWGAPQVTSPHPPSPSSPDFPGRDGRALDARGRRGTAHNGCWQQPAPAGELCAGCPGIPGLAGGRATAPFALSAHPGMGAPRAAEPGPGLLGRAAFDCVRGPPHGGRHHAGGGALLDWNRAGPVRAGRVVATCWHARPKSAGRAGRALRARQEPSGTVLLTGTCCPWSRVL